MRFRAQKTICDWKQKKKKTKGIFILGFPLESPSKKLFSIRRIVFLFFFASLYSYASCPSSLLHACSYAPAFLDNLPTTIKQLSLSAQGKKN